MVKAEKSGEVGMGAFPGRLKPKKALPGASRSWPGAKKAREKPKNQSLNLCAEYLF